jgi:hypothetical protein
MIYLVKDDSMNLEYVKAFVTLLEEAYSNPNYVNTAQWILAKLY